MRNARVKEERYTIMKLRVKGEQWGKDWYKFLRDKEHHKMERVEELIVQ